MKDQLLHERCQHFEAQGHPKKNHETLDPWVACRIEGLLLETYTLAEGIESLAQENERLRADDERLRADVIRRIEGLEKTIRFSGWALAVAILWFAFLR